MALLGLSASGLCVRSFDRLVPIGAHYQSGSLRILPLIPKVLVMFACLATVAPAVAQGDLKAAPPQLSLLTTHDPPGDACRRVDTLPLPSFSLCRCTGHSMMISTNIRCRAGDGCRTMPAAPPGRRRATGAAMVPSFKRQTKTNGEQQIYVDPRYTGRRRHRCGLDPFRVRKACSRSSPAGPRRTQNRAVQQ